MSHPPDHHPKALDDLLLHLQRLRQHMASDVQLTAESRVKPEAWLMSELDEAIRLAQLALPPALAGGDQRLAGARILVVDDTQANRLLFSVLLKRHGAEVLLANDGRAALDLVLTRRLREGAPPIDLVILDIHMPRLDGWATIAELRASGWSGPVLASSSDSDLTLEQCAHADFDGFLVKPFDQALFLTTVERMVKASRRS